jgi:hypothetical protein
MLTHRSDMLTTRSDILTARSDIFTDMSKFTDKYEYIRLVHEHIRLVCEHIRLVCEHINCHINLPSMPVLSLCLLFMFVTSFAFIISLIYSVIISLNPVERNVSINFEYLSINKNTSLELSPISEASVVLFRSE